MFVYIDVLDVLINAIKDIVINIFNFGQYVQVYAEEPEDNELKEKGSE